MGLNWIYLAVYREKWWAVVNTVRFLSENLPTVGTVTPKIIPYFTTECMHAQ